MKGLKEQWDEFSLGVKIISVIIVCCIGLTIVGGIIGALSPDANTSQQMLSNLVGNTSQGGDVIISDGELEVRISCPVEWSASIGDESKTNSYKGIGDSVIELDPDEYDVVAAAVQKTTSGNDELKVQLIKDNIVLDENSTTNDFGVVTVSTTVK